MVGRRILHYLIERRLGSGATGETWLAEDTQLERRVVLKFVPRAASSVGQDALQHEARSLAALRHPSIAAVHALESVDDTPFLVTAYEDGETLRDILQLGPLPVPEVVLVALALADALAHAHERGIVHRDVKPENIIAGVDGSLHLTDFGVAALIARGGAGDGPVGTDGYMSPDQARGGAPDPSFDIYALGVVVTELVTGVRPEALPVQPEHALRARGVPEAIVRVVRRCLAPRAGARYRNGRELHRALEHAAAAAGLTPSTAGGVRSRVAIASGVAGIIVVAAVAAALAWRALAPVPTRAARLVIEPFAVSGQSQDPTYLGTAFARTLASDLAHAGMGVAGVRGRAGDEARPLGHSARADWVLSGGLVRTGTMFRASVAITDVRTNRAVWAATEDAEDRALTGLASRLAARIARALHGVPPQQYDYYVYSEASQSLATSPLMSEALGAIRRFDTDDALSATARLVRSFPHEPEARVLRAWACMHAGWEEGARSPMRRAFIQSLDSVRVVDPRNPWPDVFRSVVASRDGALQQAVGGFTQVLERNDLTPSARAHVLSLRGQAYRDLGDSTASLADLEHALRLDGVSPVNLLILSDALGTFGKHEEALVRARQAVLLSPDMGYANSTLAQAYGRLGRWSEAVTPAWRACESQPTHSFLALEALVLEHTGQRAAAENAAREAAAHLESDWGDETLARWHALRGERDAAIGLLDRAFALGWKDTELGSLPEFSVLHDDPRFVQLLHRTKGATLAATR